MDLYYSPDGILVKTVLDAGGNDGYEDFIPSQPSSSVDAYVKEHYPSARILDIFPVASMRSFTSCLPDSS